MFVYVGEAPGLMDGDTCAESAADTSAAADTSYADACAPADDDDDNGADDDDDDGAPALEELVLVESKYRINRPGAECTLSVSGYAYVADARGGNLSKHNKATGEAFWPAGHLLMDYLVGDCDALDGSRPGNVVELGCGLGLCGLVAAALLGHKDVGRASNVVLTDGDAGVVERAAESAVRAQGAAKLAPTEAQVHWWGDVDACASLNARYATAAGGGSFDLVIAAEILYDPNVANAASAALAASADMLLRLSTGTRGGNETRREPACVVAYERRGAPLETLIDAFDKRGFDHAVPDCDDDDAGYYEDLWGNRHDEATMFWHRCLVVFTRRPAE